MPRSKDNSDGQYASFRDNIPYMAILLFVHPLCRRLHDYLRPLRAPEQAKADAVADARLRQRVSFDVTFAIGFLVILHGSSALKVLIILYLNFSLATRLPRGLIPAGTWGFNIAILFGNELCHGYSYAGISKATIGSPNWGIALDSWGGLISRWEVLFNITVLRSISFNLDYYWSLDRRAASPVEVCETLLWQTRSPY